MKIYGVNISNNVLKVLFTANALGIDYEHIPVSPMDGSTQTAEYLEISPAGKIPGLDDDGVKVFESNTICRYLAEKNNSSLYPKDLEKRIKVDQWLDFGSIHVGAALGRVFFNRVAYQMLGGEKDERSLSDGLNFLDRFLPILDAQLGKAKYITGDELTIADISLFAFLEPSEVCELDISKYANLSKWRSELQAQDWVKKVYNSYPEHFQAIVASMK